MYGVLAKPSAIVKGTLDGYVRGVVLTIGRSSKKGDIITNITYGLGINTGKRG